jgi:hypothetical protein
MKLIGARHLILLPVCWFLLAGLAHAWVTTVQPNGNGGYNIIGPNGTTFVNPNGNGGYTIISPMPQAPMPPLYFPPTTIQRVLPNLAPPPPPYNPYVAPYYLPH